MTHAQGLGGRHLTAEYPLYFGLDVIFLDTYRPLNVGLRQVANVRVSSEV